MPSIATTIAFSRTASRNATAVINVIKQYVSACIHTYLLAKLIGHVVNANWFFCSQAKQERPPNTTNHETLTAKDALVKALNDWLALCDDAYTVTTDTTFNQAVQMLSGAGAKPVSTNWGAILDVQYHSQQRTLRQRGGLSAPEGACATFDGERTTGPQVSTVTERDKWSRSGRIPKPVATDPVKNYITPGGLQRLRGELQPCSRANGRR